MQIGIVGLPNVGKSTLFKALTKKQVDAQNYPFCTIEPNVGVVEVPDERISKLSKLYNSQKTIYNTIEFVDIAGLVKDAHKGEGLGNKFLANIRECDAILQVVRDFEDNDITHVHNKIDPKSDVETINMELIFADMETINKRLDQDKKRAEVGKEKDLLFKVKVMEKVKEILENEKMLSTESWEEEELEVIKELNLLTIKPVLYALNFDEKMIGDQKMVEERVGAFGRAMGLDDDRGDTLPLTPSQEGGHIGVLSVCAKLEAELAELDKEEAEQYLQEMGMEQTGLDRLIAKGYSLLGLITMITSGEQETRGWNIKAGSKAPQAGGKIHTDFETGFICVDVINWKDLLEAGGEAQAKEKGLIRTEGKEYIVKDGDVCVFKFNR